MTRHPAGPAVRSEDEPVVATTPTTAPTPHHTSRTTVTAVKPRRLLRTALGLVVATSTALLTLGLSVPAAQADTTPAAGLPATVSADPLPTWQVSGVVWSQVTVGTTVWATGSFTKARPPGAKAGASTEVTVGNLIAYDITTGERIAAFDHTLNAQGLAVTASPDGRRVYVGGDFTTVDGQSRAHLAAFDATTGALVTTVAPSVNGQVKALAASSTTLYVGGAFTAAGESGTSKRKNLASFSTTNGAVSTGFAPTADDGAVWSMTLTPDRSKLVVGGQFSTLSGMAVYGMGALDPVTGASRPWAANAVIMDSGKGSIDALTTDGRYVYGGGFAFGAGGRFEGSFALDPADGSIRWMVDCQGDTYDVEPVGDVVYTASHSHNCTMIGQFPDTSPRSRWQHAGAYTAAPTSTNNGPDAYGWNYKGQPAPTMLHWFPNLGIGQATGQYQAAWSVTSGAGYVALGGEFPTVEGKAQQGLTRYALRTTKVTDKVGPKYDDTVPVRSAAPPTTAVSVAPGTVRVSFGAAWDEDDTRLTYDVYRDRGTAAEKLVKTVTADSSFYTLPALSVTDSGVPGGSHTYQVRVTDPYGNQLLSPVSETVDADTTTGAYATQVLLDGADHFWRLGDSGTTAYDAGGSADGTAGAGVTRGTAGALSGDANTASTFSGTATGTIGAGSTATAAPGTFTLEGWFSTTSTTGGKVLGFGNAKTGTSTSYDRQVYLGPSGKVTFGVVADKVRTVTSPTAYNDGQWHQFTASLGADGMALYLDGRIVGRDRTVTSAQALSGYWRIGGDAVSTSWPNTPTSNNLAGALDEVATYPLVLTPAQVGDHFTKSGRTSGAPSAAPADAYGADVFADGPSLQWRLGESAGPVAADASTSDNRGVYAGSPVFGQAGALSKVADRSVTFGGSNASVASASNFVYDTSYAEELWFKTTTTKGGKLIGFGSAQTGSSTTVDRNLTMTDAGKVRFAALNGTSQVSVSSSSSFNDGRWHYAVASQDPQGMALYVDGLKVGSNTVNVSNAAVGYWRVGYDKVWSGSTSAAFAGQIDEVAVYPRSLGLAEIKNRYRLGGGTVVNTAPKASFTSDLRSLDATFSGSTSTDVDGTVKSWSWSWGDGTPASTGVQATHRYARAGSYTVKLTVTDDQGATAAASQSVTVTNGLPTAAFAATTVQRTVTLDGSTSRDDDGTVTGWAWDFGDGGTATGANATHTYAADGTYTVSLKVTDNAGGVSPAGTQTVTVVKTKDPLARIASSATGVRVAFDGSGSSDPDGTVKAYAWDFGDQTGSASVRPEHVYARPGTYPVTLTVTDDQGATGTTTASVTVTDALPKAAFTSAGDALDKTFDASGSSDADGSVVGWAWDFGDGGSATTASPSHPYATPGTYRVRLTVTDDLGGSSSTTLDVVVRAVNVRPTASFTSSTADVVGSFDASGSTDSDGTVASYAWDFGDGSTGTGVSPQHTYAANGSYPVTLTVTDDRGGSGTTTATVVVSGLLAKDAFGRTATGTWGSADRGGAWSLNGGSAAFATTGSAGTMTVTPGSQPTARLGLSSTDTDLQVGFALDIASSGGGQFVRTIVRGDQSDGYGARVWVNKDGVAALYLTRVVGGTETDLTGAKVVATSVTPGTTYRIRVQAVGTGDTTLRAKVWAASGSEPSAWQLSTTDSTSSLQKPGGVALRSYLSGSATNGPLTVSFTDLTVRPSGS